MKEPGRELDAEVSRRIFGVGVIETDDCNGRDNFWLSQDGQHVLEDEWGNDRELPFFSTDIAAAWLVVEKLKKDGRALRLTQITARGRPWRWEAEFYEDSLGSASTAPHAICLAALAAVGEQGA